MANKPRVISVDSSGNVQSVDEVGVHRVRERLRRLAWWLDSSISIPGTTMTIGLDAIFGLIPILGDLVGVLLSSYIWSEAARLGAPKSVLLRMALNIGVEGVIGLVPIAGDLFDAAWKANQRNVRLLDAWHDRPLRTTRLSRLVIASIVVGVITFLALLGAGAFLALRWLVGFL